MKTIIAGTRTIANVDVVDRAIRQCGWADGITQIVSGASDADVQRALGDWSAPHHWNVDIIGAIWGLAHGIPVVYFPAAWTTFGRSAGPRRNQQMADHADALVLVWSGTSPGSADMLRRASARELRISEMLVGDGSDSGAVASRLGRRVNAE